MNNARRAEIRKICDDISTINDKLTCCKNNKSQNLKEDLNYIFKLFFSILTDMETIEFDESMSLDSIPENLQNSFRFERMEENYDKLCDVNCELQELPIEINEIVMCDTITEKDIELINQISDKLLNVRDNLYDCLY